MTLIDNYHMYDINFLLTIQLWTRLFRLIFVVRFSVGKKLILTKIGTKKIIILIKKSIT